MTPNQQHIQSFVARELAPWVASFGVGPWLTEETAGRFQASAERTAISYLEERALDEAVSSVLGVGNPAVPFVVVGLKEVLDAETPRAVRFAHEHPVAAFAAACLVVVAVLRFVPEA